MMSSLVRNLYYILFASHSASKPSIYLSGAHTNHYIRSGWPLILSAHRGVPSVPARPRHRRKTQSWSKTERMMRTRT